MSQTPGEPDAQHQQVPSAGKLSATARWIRCDNPGPMTLEGTNTWVLTKGGGRRFVVIDPGPAHEQHLTAIVDHIRGAGGTLDLVLLTHHHDDHTGGAQRLAELAAATRGDQAATPTVRGAGRGEPPVDGETVTVDGLTLHLLATPGHTGDSISVVDPAEQVLYSGDTILGRGTTVVAHPDGDLASYLDSLDRLARLASAGLISTIAPGHGPVVTDAEAVIAQYRRHRKERLDQVRVALSVLRREDGSDLPEGPSGAGDTAEARAEALAARIVERVYAEVPREVWPAAARSVRAQIDYLDEGGRRA